MSFKVSMDKELKESLKEAVKVTHPLGDFEGTVKIKGTHRLRGENDEESVYICGFVGIDQIFVYLDRSKWETWFAVPKINRWDESFGSMRKLLEYTIAYMRGYVF